VGSAGSCDDDAGPVIREVIARLRKGAAGLPVVTLSWAQSAKGAVAGPGGVPAALSGPESLLFTHRLRTLHDAILIGIQTVTVDDPQLSVRFNDGPQPQPVILDSRLRFPLDARLLKRVDRRPWIFHAEGSASVQRELTARGARLFLVDRIPEGLDLVQVLRTLRAEGIASVMVEGGARVLRAFISQRLVDQVVVTTSPSELTGIQGPQLPVLVRSVQESYGADTVTWGMLQ
jgi:3,4-dihydroxy 2-butanone 4-phosphate synthase/GTP cyclohydrolase II